MLLSGLDKEVANTVKKKVVKASLKHVEAATYLVVSISFNGKNELDFSFVEAATKAILLKRRGFVYY